MKEVFNLTLYLLFVYILKDRFPALPLTGLSVKKILEN